MPETFNEVRRNNSRKTIPRQESFDHCYLFLKQRVQVWKQEWKMTFVGQVGQDLENRATTKNSQEYPPGAAHNRRKLCYITHSSLFQAFRK